MDDCYGESNDTKDISTHPHKWPLPVQRQNRFPVLYFAFRNGFLDTDACYGGSNGAKGISAHPQKWPLPVQCQNCFRVLHFAFRNGFLGTDACYGCLFNARIASGFCILEEPLCLKYLSIRMLVVEGQMVQMTSPVSFTNGHFLFNARIASGFAFRKNHYV